MAILETTHGADQDIAEAATWYDHQQQGLGREFVNAIDQCFTRIADNPAAYPIVQKVIRRAIIARFPYAVYYLIRNEHVIVIACFHGSRAPRELQRRLARNF